MAHWNGIIIQAAMKTNQLSKKQYKELDIAQLFKEKKQKKLLCLEFLGGSSGHFNVAGINRDRQTDKQRVGYWFTWELNLCLILNRGLVVR